MATKHTEFNASMVDEAFIVSEPLNWKVLMTDMLGGATMRLEAKDTPIGEVLKGVAAYKPVRVSVFY